MPQRPSIAVILNSSSGIASGRSDIDRELQELFRNAGCDVEIIAVGSGQNPTDLARAASARAGVVVAGGGDGTVSSVAAAILGSPAALGVLPLGTLNHFAKDLGIPLDLPQAVAAVAAGNVRSVDVGQVNDRVFVNNASIGIYPGIVEQREALRRQGRRKWTAMAIATVRVLRRYRGMTVTVDVGDVVRTLKTPFVFVGNNQYSIEGSHVGARARLDEGRLFVYLTPRIRTRHLPALLARALVGRASGSGALEIIRATELIIHIRTTRLIRVAVDGEIVAMNNPLRYRARPGALRVVVPLEPRK